MVLQEIAEFVAAIDMIIGIQATAPERKPLTIHTELDYQAALQRREDLAGCLEDTPEERELIELQEGLEAWEAREASAAIAFRPLEWQAGNQVMRTDIEPEGILTEQPLAVIKIATIEDYEQATARVAQLAGVPDTTPEGRELKALVDAIMKWDQRHDDATSWE